MPNPPDTPALAQAREHLADAKATAKRLRQEAHTVQSNAQRRFNAAYKAFLAEHNLLPQKKG